MSELLIILNICWVGFLFIVKVVFWFYVAAMLHTVAKLPAVMKEHTEKRTRLDDLLRTKSRDMIARVAFLTRRVEALENTLDYPTSLDHDDELNWLHNELDGLEKTSN